MERRDYILDEIQKFGQMILGLLGKLVRERQSEQYDFSLALADQEFEEEAGFSLRMMVGMDDHNLEAFLANHPELNADNLDLLASLMIEISKAPASDPKDFLLCAERLLNHADEMDKTFNLERQKKREYIKAKLQ